MAKAMEKLTAEIHHLPDADKLRLVDAILADLDRPDPAIDKVWAKEARKRWTSHKTGHSPSVPYESVMAKHRRP